MPSDKFKRLAFAPEIDDVILTLLKMYNPDSPIVIQYADNLKDIISNGEVYEGHPFDSVLPGETEELSNGSLQISNVSQTIMKFIRQIDTPAKVDLKLILASTPNVIEKEYLNLELHDVDGDIESIGGTLRYSDLRLESFPYYSFGPTQFPGLF